MTPPAPEQKARVNIWSVPWRQVLVALGISLAGTVVLGSLLFLSLQNVMVDCHCRPCLTLLWRFLHWSRKRRLGAVFRNTSPHPLLRGGSGDSVRRNVKRDAAGTLAGS